MTARFLLSFFDVAYLVALAAWLGSLLFVSWGIVPALLPALGGEEAAKFVKTVYPRLYGAGAILGAVALPAFLGVPLSFPEYRGPWVALGALTLIAGILTMFYAANTVVPALRQSLDAVPPDLARYERLHRRLKALNLGVSLLLVFLLAAFATRPAPRTQGIIEPSPAERLRSNDGRETSGPKPIQESVNPSS